VRRPTAWVRLPVFPPGTAVYGAAILIAWATVGLVISVFPAALRAHGLAGWSGFSTFLVISTGLLVQPLARGMAPLEALGIGLALVPVGYGALARNRGGPETLSLHRRVLFARRVGGNPFLADW
jgi:hypothetical protein